MASSDSHGESLLQHLLFVLIILCFICSKKGTSPSSSSFSCCDISAATKREPPLSRRQLLPETTTMINSPGFLGSSRSGALEIQTEGCSESADGGEA